MKNTLDALKFYFVNLLRVGLFWMIWMQFLRWIFVLFSWQLIKNSGASLSDLWPVLYHSLELDFSTSSYLLAFTWFFLSIHLYWPKRFLLKTIHFMLMIFIVLYTLLIVAEIGIYPEWMVKVNAKAMEYLHQPSEILASNDAWKSVWQVVLWLSLSVLGIWFYRKVHQKYSLKIKVQRASVFTFPITILVSGLIFVGMRGGLQQIPISQSESYFSKYEIVNDISVNSAWNLAHSVLNNQLIENTNVFVVMDSTEAHQRVDKLHLRSKEPSHRLTANAKPNVVFILLESWPADLVGVLGAEHAATPQFDRWSKSGLLFTQCYSSGNRSQQGIASLLGAFPAIPITTLTDHPDRMRKTPTITRKFNEDGYSTSFIYGGELRYGNIKAYLLHNEFQTLNDVYDFPQLPQGDLGIHDEFMFDVFLKHLNQQSQPFFSIYFTLSSHSPYDQPANGFVNWNDSEDPFHNSVYYTDSVLGVFLDKASQTQWYQNTLFVILADHPHQSYTHRSIATAEYRRIPLLITGGALQEQFRGKNYDQICTQVDVPITLMQQMGYDYSEFQWGNDLMNPDRPPFAFFEIIQGFGFITPDGYISHDHFNGTHLFNTIQNDSLSQQVYKNGASYLQVLFDHFNRL